jgi:hypothetical protein
VVKVAVGRSDCWRVGVMVVEGAMRKEGAEEVGVEEVAEKARSKTECLKKRDCVDVRVGVRVSSTLGLAEYQQARGKTDDRLTRGCIN